MDSMTLKEFFKKAIGYKPDELRDYLIEAFDLRFCDRCGKAFWSGYYDNGDYYCERCLPYPSHAWKERCERDDDSYWSEWGDDDTKRIVEVLNEAIEEVRNGM